MNTFWRGWAVQLGSTSPTAPQLSEMFRIFCAAAILGSTLILVGWAINETAFKAGAVGLRSTQPLGAVLLLIAGAAMALTASTHSVNRLLGRLLGLGLIAGSSYVIAQNSLDVDWGTDRLLFAEAIVAEQTGLSLRPGRPAGAALIGILGCGWCLLTLHSKHKTLVRTYLVVAGVGFSGATISLLAYGLNIAPLYAMGLYAQASLPGSLILWLLFACALIRKKDLGVIAALSSDTLGAISARSILAWGACLLIVLVTVVQFASHAHWYRSELIVLLVTVTGLATLSFGLAAHMNGINAIDAQRQAVVDQARALLIRATSASDAHHAALADKRQLVANLAHELRNPLAALSYTRELLQSDRLTPEQRTTAHGAMERQMRKLKAIVDEGLANYDETKPSSQVSSPMG